MLGGVDKRLPHLFGAVADIPRGFGGAAEPGAAHAERSFEASAGVVA